MSAEWIAKLIEITEVEITSEASHIIGLTGLPSVGKGEVACALAGLAAERGWRLTSGE